jgi:serine protease AprX
MGRTFGLLLALACALPATAAFAAPAAAATPGGVVPVIVRYAPAERAAAERAVAAAGGTVGTGLDLVESFTATVPASRLAAVASAVGVRAVTPDGRVRLAGKSWMVDPEQTWMAGVAETTRTFEAWKRSDPSGRKLTGQGVGVALIDSGVSPVPGLDEPGKVVNGPDLSFESAAPNLAHLDTFGHGTHMAGIIAGRDADIAAGGEAKAAEDPARFVGIAPGATIVNVKVAATDGAVDVSQVIAGIDWVVAHRNDPGLNIRVLNLSFGTDSVQDTQLDPLSHAVEAAWRNGIVVVVAVGNDGLSTTRVTMPAANPYVLAVGAADSMGTAGRADDVVASFTNRGNATRHADLVAPGRSIVGLRDPNAFIDSNYPTGRLNASLDPGQRYFKGSGTSQATAVVSGAVALLLQQRPSLAPDQVKKLLTANAEPMPRGDLVARGAGQLNVDKATGAALPKTGVTQTFPASTGLGSLEASRGGSHVADPTTGEELTGEIDVTGQAWDPDAWAGACTTGTTWHNGGWNARTWSGDSWQSRTWSGESWSSVVWEGRTWSARTWSGRTWSGRTWSGGSWAGTIWN